MVSNSQAKMASLLIFSNAKTEEKLNREGISENAFFAKCTTKNNSAQVHPLHSFFPMLLRAVACLDCVLIKSPEYLVFGPCKEHTSWLYRHDASSNPFQGGPLQFFCDHLLPL